MGQARTGKGVPPNTYWLGKSKKDCPPSPCNRTFKPAVPVELAVAVPPVTPEAAMKELAGALILYRIERPLYSQ